MMIIGLTGSIASGKSTLASVLKRYHFPIFDSDKTVHSLMGPNGSAVPAILSEFGKYGSLQSGIDRQKLGALVFHDSQALSILESLLHPRVAQARERFLQQACLTRRKAVILDVPLLFETKTDLLCDVTMMAWAPLSVIRRRALARPSMTEAKLNAILAKQMPQIEKARLADAKITTGLGFAIMTQQTKQYLRKWHLR